MSNGARRLLLCVLIVAGCRTVAIRDANVLAAEIAVHEANTIQAADFLLMYARHLGEKNPGLCATVAELGLTLKIRGPWHAQASRVTGGLAEADPGPLPAVPSTDTVCRPAEDPIR